MGNNRQPIERLALRVSEAAKALTVSRWTVGRLIDTAQLAASRVGTITVITADELRRYLSHHETRTARKRSKGEVE